ncbi:unnamed protein product [Larinioides sclopetarius]|uniref:Uncharacterized protein n=1 Tax=Larinioides sclopetarius TaxID=280406 RepID=A0AAV1Z963_9ARAC
MEARRQATRPHHALNNKHQDRPVLLRTNTESHSVGITSESLPP